MNMKTSTNDGWDDDGIKLMNAILGALPHHGDLIDFTPAIEGCAAVIGWIIAGIPERDRAQILGDVNDAIRANMVHAEKSGSHKRYPKISIATQSRLRPRALWPI